jgi:hypothetical protein
VFPGIPLQSTSEGVLSQKWTRVGRLFSQKSVSLEDDVI